MIIAPCRDCDKKGCGAYHSKCEKFKEFLEQKDVIYRNRKEAGLNRNCRAPIYAKTTKRNNYG